MLVICNKIIFIFVFLIFGFLFLIVMRWLILVGWGVGWSRICLFF